jgi:hypothetical protein
MALDPQSDPAREHGGSGLPSRAAGNPPAAAARGSVQPERAPHPHPWLVVFCALVGGAIAWGALERAYPFYATYEPAVNSAPKPRQPGELDKLDAFFWNMGLTHALVGLALGSCLGMAQGIQRGSVAWMMAGMILGATSGSAAGMAGGIAAHEIFERMGRTETTNPVLQAMLAHGVAWSIIGFGIGLAAGVVSGNKSVFFHAMAGGVLGGVAAGLVHPPLHTLLFDENDIALRIPAAAASRLLWVCLPAILIGLVMGGLKPPPHSA